jgi:hypothetical protein
MSATNFTPIQLYRTSTAAAVPTAGNLAAGELAINLTDEKLFFKNAAGVIKVLSSTGTSSIGGTNTQVQYNNNGVLGGSANFVFDGTRVGIGTASPAAASALDVIGNIRMPSGNSLYWAGGNEIINAVENNRMTFGVNGSERMRITSAGDVGIGTNAPVVRFEVAGPVTTTFSPNVYNTVLTGTSSATSGNAGSGISFRGYTTGSATISDVAFLSGVKENTTDGNYAGALVFGTRTNGSGGGSFERMRIDSAGNVGIGVSPSSDRLNVGGNIQATNATYGYLGITSGAVQGQFAANGTAATLDIRAVSNHPMTFFTNNAERMRIDANGNLMVGTTGAVQKLTIGNASSASSGINLRTTKTDFTIAPSNTDAGGVTIGVGWVAGGQGPMIFDVGGEKMRIDASGNVGIGTNAPGTKLDVQGTVAGNFFQNLYNDSSNAAAQTLYLAKSFGASGVQFGQTRSSANGFVNLLDAAALTFGTSNTERMRIDANGNVGINISTPSTNFEVNGGIIAGGQNTQTHPNVGPVGFKAQWNFSGGAGETDIYNLFASATASFNFYQSTGNGTAQVLYYMKPSSHEFYTGGSERMRIDNVGNVGIGCVPGYRLDVASGDTTGNIGYAMRLRSNPTATAASIQFTNSAVSVQNGLITCTDGGALTLQSDGGASEIRFRVNGAERARIDTSGNLGVGTTSPTFYSGRVVSSADGASIAMFAANNSDTGSSSQIVFDFYRNGTRTGNITNTNAATAYNTSSDYRLKEIDGPIANSGAYIDALKPVQGSWKADGSRFIGLLAHEVQEVSETPIATGEKDGEKMQAMDYSAPELITNLIAEIQSLRARVAQLEGN